MNRAIIVTDEQNDFCPGGTLAVKDGDQVIGPTNLLVASASGDDIIIFTKDWHPAKSPHFTKWPVHCVADTPGAQLHKNLVVPVNSFTLHKGTGDKDGYSPFEEEVEITILSACDGYVPVKLTLDDLLKFNKVEEVIVCGLATDYCVKVGCLDARRLGYRVILAKDACRAVNLQPNDENLAICEMLKAGVVIKNTREVINDNKAR